MLVLRFEFASEWTITHCVVFGDHKSAKLCRDFFTTLEA